MNILYLQIIVLFGYTLYGVVYAYRCRRGSSTSPAQRWWNSFSKRNVRVFREEDMHYVVPLSLCGVSKLQQN